MYSILKFFKVSIFESLSYKYMKTWCFHGQCKASGLGTNKISYNIFDYAKWAKQLHVFRRKTKSLYIHSIIQTKKKEKYLKNEAAESYLEPCQISITERFCIIYVWYGSKCTLEVLQVSKINLKWINTKTLEKTVHFFNVDLVEDNPT